MILHHNLFNFALLLIFLSSFSQGVFSQVGLSVSPPRVFYQLNPGESGMQKIVVSNVSKTLPLNLSITFGDWKYDEWGNNQMFAPDSLPNSCANWLTIGGGTYLSLKPGDSREIEVTMTVPAQPKDGGTVQTAMLYVTQMNPADGVDEKGMAIKVNVRSGVKIYRQGKTPEIKKLEIENLSYDKEKNALDLVFENTGTTWANGNVTLSLFHTGTGKEVTIDPIRFYTLPGDHRTMALPLRKTLEAGRYTATVMLDCGDDTVIEAAELEFSYE